MYSPQTNNQLPQQLWSYRRQFLPGNGKTCCLGITIGFITAGSSGWPGKTWAQETWMGPDKYQQLPRKASILQLNDETTGNTENRADHSSLFEIFVHHYLISSACFQDFFFVSAGRQTEMTFYYHYFFSFLYAVFVHSVLITFTRLHVSCVLWQE